MKQLSIERMRIAKIFKRNIEVAIAELGNGYDVEFHGAFCETPIRIEIEILPRKRKIINTR